MLRIFLSLCPSQIKKESARSQGQLKRREREKSSVRAKVEHIFGIVKGKLRFRKTRYRDLQKQIAELNMMFASANLILADSLIGLLPHPEIKNPACCLLKLADGVSFLRCRAVLSYIFSLPSRRDAVQKFRHYTIKMNFNIAKNSFLWYCSGII